MATAAETRRRRAELQRQRRARQTLHQRRARSVYIRVPRVDFPHVRIGRKRQFRITELGQRRSGPPTLPAAIVVWCLNAYVDEPEESLVFCERSWSERLGEISPDSIAREGFATRAEYIAYWRRYRHPDHSWNPLQPVTVFDVRPWREDDLLPCAAALYEHLYPGHLGAE